MNPYSQPRAELEDPVVYEGDEIRTAVGLVDQPGNIAAGPGGHPNAGRAGALGHNELDTLQPMRRENTSVTNAM